MFGLTWIVKGFAGESARMPEGGYQTRPATRGELVLVGLAAALTVAAPAFGLVSSLLR